MVKNIGSAARDYCMLERNLLSHVKLTLLLSLLSSSFLLRTRLFSNQPGEGGFDYEHLGLPLSIILYAAAMIAMVGGVLEFWTGQEDFRSERAFLTSPRGHLFLLSIVSAVILGTCVTLLATSAV